MVCAVYAGTFDPMTRGHQDILARAARLFDRVIVAVAESRAKNTLLSHAERIDLARELTKGMAHVEVEGFSGLLCDFVRAHGANVLVRGIRPVGDFDGEYQMAQANRALMPEVETVFLMSAPEVASVKGTLVREIVRMGGNVSAFLEPAATKAVAAKYGN